MIKRIIRFLLFFLSVVFLLFYFFQEKFFFLPEKKIAKDYQFTFDANFEEVNLITPDNETINAIHFKVENPKGVLLFFHGNRGSLLRWGKIVQYFTKFNYDVFVMDYRNYGKSTGSYNEEKMYEDAQLCYDYVREKFSEDKIVVYGRSLGATFATRVAASNKPKELVLEAPFYNLKAAVHFKLFFTPNFLLKYKFETHKDIVKVMCPTTIFHGDKDNVTPFQGSKELFELIAQKEKTYVHLPQGTHHNVMEFEAYQQKMKEILK